MRPTDMTTTLARDLVRVWRTHGVYPHTMPLHLTSIVSPPRVVLQNAAFENGRHRKLHVEVGKVDAVSVVHSVMYPRPTFDVPILALDLVCIGGAPTFGIVDCCPVTDDLQLPEEYEEAVRRIQAAQDIVPVARDLMPDWGKSIFSNVCYMTRHPTIDPVAFCAYAMEMTRMHMNYCDSQDPCQDIDRVRRNHGRFCHHQLQNDRTRAVLAKALGDPVAREYMATIMFDSIVTPVYPPQTPS